MRALDLFCGAGGAAMGLHRAGFEVVGVDVKPQPRYPFAFVQGDALAPPVRLDDFDLIWASPPCQRWTRQYVRNQLRHADLIAPTRELLAGHPLTVIENVPGAPLRPDVRLNGWMFPELRVIRERIFETSFYMLAPPGRAPRGLIDRGYVTAVGGGTGSWAFRKGYAWTAGEVRRAMGCPWMSRAEVVQAVPPAYAEFIGRAAARAIEARREAAA